MQLCLVRVTLSDVYVRDATFCSIIVLTSNGNDIEKKRNYASIIGLFQYRSETNPLIPERGKIEAKRKLILICFARLKK